VDKVVDAVGFQARDRRHPDQECPDQVIADAARLVNPTGTIAVAGVYLQKRPASPTRRDVGGGLGRAVGDAVQ